MNKLNNVIMGLKCSVCPNAGCINCRYYRRSESNDNIYYCNRDLLKKDTLELLEDSRLPEIQKIYFAPSISLDRISEYLSENADCPPDPLRCNYDCKECWKTALTELIKAVEKQ